MQTKQWRIGTRGSALALAQAHETRARLAAAHGVPEPRFEIIVIKTEGDRVLDRPLADIGGKGLFTKEIEEALLDGAIDLAVHSSKDMPTALPDGLAITAFLPREDVRDAFVSKTYASLEDLPRGAVVGTSSLRRQATVLRKRPDLKIVQFRGNVNTRLTKLEAGVADATLLAYAGLKRLGLAHLATHVLPVETFLPAVGQGAICIETRADDTETRALVGAIHDPTTAIALAAERAFLARLDGSCRTPIAGYARLDRDLLIFDGLILKTDGSMTHSVQRRGRPGSAVAIGSEAGDHLRTLGGADFFNPTS